jgi:hypothetical protein
VNPLTNCPLVGYSGERRFDTTARWRKVAIAEKFDTANGYGPTCVRNFVADTQILGERTADQWQQDALGLR